jgi:prepilin-type N-terminal cleavage/methylation domain-containing protein
MSDERGFTLIEMMCAMLVLSLTLLIASALSHAIQSQERRSALRLAISREAVSVMENWRMQSTLLPQSNSRQLVLQNVTVTETIAVQPVAGVMQASLSYAWQEGGRPYVQTWATLHP